jgi:hypothetical protein
LKNKIIDEFNQINKKAKNKKEKRDFGNWYNESLQIFNLLNQTVYFKTFKKTFLMLSLSQEIIEKYNQRSQKEKEKYFEWHKVNREKGYELHHIVPLYMATNRKQMEMIDNHKNLIYIPAKLHRKIPDDTHIQLYFKENKFYLKKPHDNLDFINKR